MASSLDLRNKKDDENLILHNFCGQHAEDIVRVAVHREDIDLLYRYFEQKFNKNNVYELIKMFTKLVMPGLIGREKSKEFQDQLTKFLKYYRIDRDLNQFEYEGMQNWYASAYNRGLLRIIDWRMSRGEPRGLPDMIQPLVDDILYSACYNGSEEVIEHALTNGCRFFRNGSNVDIRRMVATLIFDRRFTTEQCSEKQSLLSLVTMTNKDPQAAKILLGYLQKYNFVDMNIKESLKQSFLWSIEYCAFEMLHSLICGDHEPEMLTVFKDTLPISVERGTLVQFKEKVEKYANLSQDPKWKPELKQIHCFIVKLRQKLEG